MALALTLSTLQTNSCADWILTDTTGEYDAATNVGGWSTSGSNVGTNLRIDNDAVLVAELIITFPSGTEETVDILTNWEELTGLTNTAFDSSTTPTTTIYTLTADMFGLDAFPDGVYTLVYRVGDASTYATSTVKGTVTYTFGVYCAIECCIEQRLALVPDEYTCEACSNAYLETTMTLWTLLQALKMSACLASTAKFENILATLQAACEEASGTCCS